MQIDPPRRRKVSAIRPTLHRGDLVFFDSMMVNVAAARDVPEMELLLESDDIDCVLPHSVLTEAHQPSVPPEVRQATARFLHTIRVGLSACEVEHLNAFLAQHLGNAEPKNIFRDLSHVWESAKYGGRLFVTNDMRLRTRASAVYVARGIWITTLAEAADLLDDLSDYRIGMSDF